MPSNIQASAISPDTKPKLEAALRQNEQATQEVKVASEELAVIHAVLDKSVEDAQRIAGDIGAAVTRTDEVEKRLVASAEKLDKVNQQLEKISADIATQGK